MPTFEFKIKDPAEMAITMEITMTMEQWNELAFQLKRMDDLHSPAKWFLEEIRKASLWAKKEYYNEDEPFDLVHWSERWQLDARTFFERHALPYRMTNALILATNVLDGQDNCVLFSHSDYPYPDFDKSITGIVHGTYPVRNFGIKYRALLAEALAKDLEA